MLRLALNKQHCETETGFKFQGGFVCTAHDQNCFSLKLVKLFHRLKKWTWTRTDWIFQCVIKIHESFDKENANVFRKLRWYAKYMEKLVWLPEDQQVLSISWNNLSLKFKSHKMTKKLPSDFYLDLVTINVIAAQAKDLVYLTTYNLCSNKHANFLEF